MMMLLSNRYCVLLAISLMSSFYLVKGDDSACWAVNGRCQTTTNSFCLSYRTGLCAGPTNRKCCVIGEDFECWKRGGTCKENYLYCSGSYTRGLCGGGLSRQCCL